MTKIRDLKFSNNIDKLNKGEYIKNVICFNEANKGEGLKESELYTEISKDEYFASKPTTGFKSNSLDISKLKINIELK